MKEEQFEDYLRHVHAGGGMAESSIRTRIANYRRVEHFEGDLDALFNRDGLKDQRSRLEYTRDDQRADRSPRHKVPINGDLHDGSATLKSAIKLYWEFCRYVSEPPQPPPVQAGPPPPTMRTTSPQKTSAWPLWSQPDRDEALLLAQVVARYARFLRPEIVRAIAEDNDLHRAEWSEALEKRDIDPRAYLWPGSTCASPLRGQ